MKTHERLKAWRTARDPRLTLEAAGELVGVKHSTWSEWESGTRSPGLEKAVDIERVTEGAIRIEAWGFDKTLIDRMAGIVDRRAAE